MAIVKTKKRKKYSRAHGKNMGTAGTGFRKKGKGKGHRGGKGMSGTGKRSDQKKTLVTKLYGNEYFGKNGITSRGTKRDKRKRINIEDIESNINNYLKKGLAKKTKEGIEVELKGYKILGNKASEKLIVKCSESSKKAKEVIEKAGGKIITEKKPENKSDE